MGSIISKVDAISGIRWCALRKGRVTKARRVLSFDDGSAIIELDSGQYTVVGRHHSPNGNWAVLNYGLEKFTGAVLDGLVAMGILSKAQIKEHKDSAKRRSIESERKYAKRALASACETLGIPVPELPE